MYTLVGSRAMKQHFPDAREPLDWDYFSRCTVGSEPVHTGGRLDVFEHPMLSWNFGTVATPDELYTIKISHLFWVVSDNKTWDKHMGDIIFLQRKGCVFIRELYDILFPIWKQHHQGRKTNTNMTSTQFFGDAVQRKYVHDSLHETVKYDALPMYQYLLKEGSEVDCSWDKFSNDLTHSGKLNLMREEVYVTALERLIIPSNYEYSPRAAYHWALRRTLTSLMKNEWSLWIALHLDELRRPDVDYVQRHRDNSHLLILNGES